MGCGDWSQLSDFGRVSEIQSGDSRRTPKRSRGKNAHCRVSLEEVALGDIEVLVVLPPGPGISDE